MLETVVSEINLVTGNPPTIRAFDFKQLVYTQCITVELVYCTCICGSTIAILMGWVETQIMIAESIPALANITSYPDMNTITIIAYMVRQQCGQKVISC